MGFKHHQDQYNHDQNNKKHFQSILPFILGALLALILIHSPIALLSIANIAQHPCITFLALLGLIKEIILLGKSWTSRWVRALMDLFALWVYFEESPLRSYLIAAKTHIIRGTTFASSRN